MLMRAYQPRTLAALTIPALIAALFLYSRPVHAGQYRKFADLDGKRIGILDGTMFEYIVNETLDYTQLRTYSNLNEMIDDLLGGEIDCMVDDEPVLRYLSGRNPRLRLLEGMLKEDSYGLAMRKEDADLAAQFSTVLTDFQEQGMLERLVERWMHGFEVDTAGVEATEGTRLIRLGVYTESPPFVFKTNYGKTIGLDVELVQSICRRLRFRLETISYDGFDDIFDALESGEVDVIAACISITAERETQYAFTTPYYQAGVAAMVAVEK